MSLNPGNFSGWERPEPLLVALQHSRKLTESQSRAALAQDWTEKVGLC